MPSLKADGSLRPATRSKPRSPESPPLFWLRFWCLNSAGMAPAKGIRPARSAIPGPPELGPLAESAPNPAALGGRALWAICDRFL